MEDELFIGTATEIQMAEVLGRACVQLNKFGIALVNGDLFAVSVVNGQETRHDGGRLHTGCYLRLLVKGKPTFVSLTQVETEIVPGYSIITDPFTIGVGVWVGADIQNRLIAGCVAHSIAVSVRGKILDSEHKWVHNDLSEPIEIMNALERNNGHQSGF